MFDYAKPQNANDEKAKILHGQKKNVTGIPDSIKERFENVSGLSFDDVRVHYNSGKPARLQALAYTQGANVYVAPGQERHLGHELGHVVQQKRGLAAPTASVNGFPVNDEIRLEKQADILSDMSMRAVVKNSEKGGLANITPAGNVAQRVLYIGDQLMNPLEEDGLTPISPEYYTANKTLLDKLILSPTAYRFPNAEELAKYISIKGKNSRFTSSYLNVGQGSAALLSQYDKAAETVLTTFYSRGSSSPKMVESTFITTTRLCLMNDLGPNYWNIFSALYKKKSLRPFFDMHLGVHPPNLFDKLENQGFMTNEKVRKIWADLRKYIWPIVTHPHADHNAGNELDLLEDMGGVNGSLNKFASAFVKRPVVQPQPKVSDINSTSLVTYKEFGRTTFLYPGDRPVEDLIAMVLGIPLAFTAPSTNHPVAGGTLLKNAGGAERIANPLGENITVTAANQIFAGGIPVKGRHVVVAASHHGSRTGTNTEFVKLFKESASLTFIISAGIGNIFKHPHPESIAAMSGSEVADKMTMNTQDLKDTRGESIQGSLVVKTDGEQIARFAKITSGIIKKSSSGMNYPVAFAAYKMDSLFLNSYDRVSSFISMFKRGAPRQIMESEEAMIERVNKNLAIGKRDIADFFGEESKYMEAVGAIGSFYWKIYEEIRDGTKDPEAMEFQFNIDTEAYGLIKLFIAAL